MTSPLLTYEQRLLMNEALVYATHAHGWVKVGEPGAARFCAMASAHHVLNIHPELREEA